jgi:hypothetical protein
LDAICKLLAGYACYQEAAAVLRRAVKLARAEEWKVSPEDRFEVQWGLLHLEKKDYRRAGVVVPPRRRAATDRGESHRPGRSPDHSGPVCCGTANSPARNSR